MNKINDKNSKQNKEVVLSHHQRLSSLLSLFEFSFIVPTENKVNIPINSQFESPLINNSPLSSNSTSVSLSEKFKSDKISLKKFLTSSSFIPKKNSSFNNKKKKKKKHVHFGKDFVQVINVQNYKAYNIIYNIEVKKRRIIYGSDTTKCTCIFF